MAHAKAQAAQPQKEARKKQRAELAQAYQPQAQQDPTLTTSVPSTEPVQSRLRSFKDKTFEDLWKQGQLEENVTEMPNAISNAHSIFHLRSLLRSGTALEILSGDRKGQICLRVNDQYRLCFYWISGEGAYKIELVDYHR